MPTGYLPRALALICQEQVRLCARYPFAAGEITTAEQLEQAALACNGDRVQRAVIFRLAVSRGGDSDAWRDFLSR